MRIGVISPVAHGTGASCVSMLIALRLGYGSTDKVCLTHTHPSDSTLKDMGGVAKTEDKTTSTSMIVQTFQYGGLMTEEGYSQYCNAVSKQVDLFTHVRHGDVMSSFEDAKFLSNYVMEKFPHKHVVVDADDHSDGAVLDVINRCDVVVFVSRISPRDVVRLKTKLADYKKSGVLEDKKVMLIFNAYQNEVAPQKELAKLIGVPPKSVYFMPMNPYIAWATYASAFPKFWNFVAKSDPRVLSVKQELDRLVQGMAQKGKSSAKKKEFRLFGVKHSKVQDNSAEVPVNPVSVSDGARSYADELYHLNYTHVPETCPIPEGAEASPALVNGFVEQPVEEDLVPTEEQVGHNNLLWDDDDYGLLKPKAKVVESKPVSASMDGLEGPNNVEAHPVELVSEPSGEMPPTKVPKPKPVTPDLPKATLKPRTVRPNVPKDLGDGVSKKVTGGAPATAELPKKVSKPATAELPKKVSKPATAELPKKVSKPATAELPKNTDSKDAVKSSVSKPLPTGGKPVAASLPSSKSASKPAAKEGGGIPSSGGIKAGTLGGGK